MFFWDGDGDGLVFFFSRYQQKALQKLRFIYVFSLLNRSLTIPMNPERFCLGMLDESSVKCFSQLFLGPPKWQSVLVIRWFLGYLSWAQ